MMEDDPLVDLFNTLRILLSLPAVLKKILLFSCSFLSMFFLDKKTDYFCVSLQLEILHTQVKIDLVIIDL